jgi:hypothetical protein
MRSYKMEYEFIDEMKSVLKRTDIDGKVSYIPNDPANSDYQRYLRWLENPNEVEHLTEIVPANE